MAATSDTVITYAPASSAVGAWLFVASLYCNPAWSNGLNLLSVVVCSMTLGALIVARPRHLTR